MADETRDPREAVLYDVLAIEFNAGRAEVSPHYPARRTFTPAEALARLDAADPLRTMWPEVRSYIADIAAGGSGGHGVESKARLILARIREIEGGEHG